MEKQYKELDLFVGVTVEDAVTELLRYKEEGKLASVNFNNVMLYSDTVTMDDAYISITGKTQAALDQEQQERIDAIQQKNKEHQAKIPELTKVWMEKGREILAEDKWARWDEIVPIRLADLYNGMELGATLDIVKILNTNGTLDEAKDKIISQGHSGMSFGLVCAMVEVFSDRGKEFADYAR